MKTLTFIGALLLGCIAFNAHSQHHIANCSDPEYGFYHSLEDFIWNKPQDTNVSISINSGKVYFENAFFEHDEPPRQFALGFTTCHHTYWYTKGGYYPVIHRGRYTLIGAEFRGSNNKMEEEFELDEDQVLASKQILVLDLKDGSVDQLNITKLRQILSEDGELSAAFSTEEEVTSSIMIDYVRQFNKKYDPEFFQLSAKAD